MASGFTIPTELAFHVTAICGESGKEWLASLPEIARHLQDRWSLKIGEPFAAGEFNFVAPAETDRGEPLVLKISPPYESLEIWNEAEYLRRRDGQGAVRLMREERSSRAILMSERFPARILLSVSVKMHSPR